MPQVNYFKKNIVLYLRGETPNSIYLIKEGNIVLTYDNAKKQSKKTIGKGEFFGLFSSIGNYPRQEDAVTYSDVELLLFNNKEFESLVGKNAKLSLQLMNILSKELRSIHKKSKAALQIETPPALDIGLYNYLKMYEKKEDSKKVVYLAKKIIETYPNSENIDEVKKLLNRFENKSTVKDKDRHSL